MRSVFIVAAGRLFQMLAAFLTLRLATTLMGPAEVGQVNQLLAFVTLFATGIVVPLVVYFARGIVGWVDAGQFRRRMREVTLAILAATMVLTPIGVSIQRLGDVVHGIAPVWFASLFALYVFGFSAYTLLLNCVAVLGQRVRGAAYSNLAAWGGLALAVVLLHSGGTPWHWTLGIFLGYVLAAQGLWAVASTRPTSVAAVAAPLSLRPPVVWSFVWPQVVMFALWWTQSQSYRFLLAEVSTVAAVGVFFAAYALVSVPMQAFESAFNEVYSPTLYREFEAGGPGAQVLAWNRYAAAYVPSILIFGCFLAGCAPHLSRLALGPAFQVDAVFFALPAVAEAGRALGSVNHVLGVAKLDMRRLLPPAFAGAILAPVFVVLLAPSHPLFGTGLALAIASAGVLSVVYLQSRRTQGLVWPWGRMGLAVLAGLPLVLGGVAAHARVPDSAAHAVVTCVILGVGALLGLYGMSRPWVGTLRMAARG